MPWYSACVSLTRVYLAYNQWGWQPNHYFVSEFQSSYKMQSPMRTESNIKYFCFTGWVQLDLAYMTLEFLPGLPNASLFFLNWNGNVVTMIQSRSSDLIQEPASSIYENSQLMSQVRCAFPSSTLNDLDEMFIICGYSTLPMSLQ